jgi:hypothetical protein
MSVSSHHIEYHVECHVESHAYFTVVVRPSLRAFSSFNNNRDASSRLLAQFFKSSLAVFPLIFPREDVII